MNSAIATQQTDLEIRLREWNKGHEAFKSGLLETSCPWNSGLTYKWWMDGYRSINYPIAANAEIC